MVVGLTSSKHNLRKIKTCIKLMIALKSYKAFSNFELPIVHAIVKPPRSFSFFGNFIWRIELHSLVNFIISYSSKRRFFDITSFMNLSNASLNGKVYIKFFEHFKKLDEFEKLLRQPKKRGVGGMDFQRFSQI